MRRTVASQASSRVSLPSRWRASSAYPIAWVEVSQAPNPRLDEALDLLEPAGLEHPVDPSGDAGGEQRRAGMRMPATRTRAGSYRSHAAAKPLNGVPVIAATSSARTMRRTLAGSIFAAATGSSASSRR